MFTTTLMITIEHINYGRHLAHDRLITLMHEVRLRFFEKLGQSEMNFYGIGLILKSITVNYRQEAFRGQTLTFTISIGEISKSSFTLDYEITNEQGRNIADATITLVGFDYGKHQIIRLSALGHQALTDNHN
ncbi:MAG: acyl-CoA thioesterase [Ostreibacterium sp.]